MLAAYRLSFGASPSTGRRSTRLRVYWWRGRWCATNSRAAISLDALVDLPFALPTSVAGITLTALYAQNGWIGRYFELFGIKVAFTPLGIVVALTFIGLPFVVRTVQPVLQDLEPELEEAAATLGANRVCRPSAA